MSDRLEEFRKHREAANAKILGAKHLAGATSDHRSRIQNPEEKLAISYCEF